MTPSSGLGVLSSREMETESLSTPAAAVAAVLEDAAAADVASEAVEAASEAAGVAVAVLEVSTDSDVASTAGTARKITHHESALNAGTMTS